MDTQRNLVTRREFVRTAAMGAVASALTNSLTARQRRIPAIVTPDWLVQSMADPTLLVIDIRNAEQYKKGHIPGALNLPMNLWAVSRNGLSLELPPENDLRSLIGNAGITSGSRLVVVNTMATDFSRADPTRVAWTCAVAGIENVAVLDGGQNRWVREIKTLSTEPVNPKAGTYDGKMNPSLIASKEYVLGKLGKSIIADTRLPEDYFGIASKPGHIRSSVNLPTPWAFASDGSYRKEEDLLSMAAGVLGTGKSKEIITYCGVGGFAATWWLLLTQIFGYQSVKLYDGSLEEWTQAPAGPVTAHAWH